MVPPISAADDYRGFILANTKLMQPPLVPEVRLYLAEESLPLWEKTEEQLGEINVPPPFWAFAWAGGQALARYVLDHRNCAAGKQVVDLGAGSGLCAIAASLAGASDVLAADVEAFAGHAMALNAQANGVTIRVTTDNILERNNARADLLLIGDLFYERELSEQVISFATRVRKAGAEVLIGDPRRSFFPIDRFEQVAEYSVPVTRALEDSEIKRTAVWRLSTTS